MLLAQVNPTVGAIESNTELVANIIKAYGSNHDIIVFPELMLTGYPPEDLLLRPALMPRVTAALEALCKQSNKAFVVVGHPYEEAGMQYNALSILHQGKIIHTYKKQHLPNKGVFDEKRYFVPGPEDTFTLNIHDKTLGFRICEDIWNQGPIEQCIEKGAEIVVCINASPFEANKHAARLGLLKQHLHQGTAFVYVNMTGGQDELVFDGQSFVTDEQGEIKVLADAFAEDLVSVEFKDKTITGKQCALLDDTALLYQALVTGLKEYVLKNGFSDVVLGLSGGIDSALTLALAVDALGAGRVHPILLPSRYTSDISNQDAIEMVKNLGVNHQIMSIEDGFKAMQSTLKPHLTDQTIPGITAQNMQARLRGLLLMAYSNSTGALLLSTSNKSESAVGYTTLYGDMCGGFAPIKDVLKTEVYKLAHYRNSVNAVIPERIITRAPSAELAPNQTDQDTLPGYDELDEILNLYMNEKLTAEEIAAKGFAYDTVKQVTRMVTQNEYKRRQAPPGTKVTSRAFGRDWRYPITSKF